MLFVPCRDHCYVRCGKSYTKECDTECDYAKVCLENKELKEKDEDRKKILEEICTFLISSNRPNKHGALYMLTDHELAHLLKLIKKLVY